MSQQQEISLPEIRVDRADLRKPRRLDDGTKIYEARLSIADQPLKYPWGEEIPTREALSSQEYLDGLKGISVLVQHAPEGRIDGRAPRAGDGRRIGSTISSRFDDATGEVIVELAIPEKEDQLLVEQKLSKVSEGYTPTIERIDGKAYQTKRIPNHIAVTEQGRAKTAEIRVDALGGSLNLEEAMAKIQQMAAEIAGLQQQLSEAAGNGAAYASQAETATGEKDALMKVLEAIIVFLGGSVRADSEEIINKIKEKIGQEGQLVADLRQRADSLKIEIPESAKDSSSIRKAIAIGLGAEQSRCDSAEYCDGVIFAASKIEKIGQSVPLRTDSKQKTDYPV